MIQLQKILYPTDFSDLSLYALRYARNFAEAFSAELHVLHVVDEAYQNWVTMGPNTIPVGPTAQEMLDLAREQMAAFMAEHLGNGTWRSRWSRMSCWAGRTRRSWTMPASSRSI